MTNNNSTETVSPRVVVVNRDNERNRWMFWACKVNRFCYYKEHGTVFDSEADARTVMKYYRINGLVVPEATAHE